jgi:DNA ligase D-like protein (predicted ligase)
MLATLSHEHFSDKDWIYERKFDGVRCLIFKTGGDLRIMSRNQKKLNKTYPELVDPAKSQSLKNYIIDGEIVTFEGDVTSFSRLQDRINVDEPSEDLLKRIGVYVYVFDIICLENYDLSEIELHHRKAILKEAFNFDNKIRYTIHRNEEGEAFLEEACKKNWEGLIAKRKNSSYVHSRSKNWLKFKCTKRQEFVIGGFTDPRGERKGFGALLIGFYDKKKLKYAGKVGTGYDDDFLVSLRKKMEKIRRDSSPFDTEVNEKHANWINPRLVGEIGFTEWTGSDKLRHPRFLGLRDDKKPEEVVKEIPK